MTRTIDDVLLEAALLYDRKEYEKAVDQLSLLIEQHPAATAFHLRARCQRALGRDQEALSDLNTSLELDPDNADGYRERAQLHFLSKQIDLAHRDNELAEHYASAEDSDDDCEDDNFHALHKPAGEVEREEQDDLFNRVCEAREEFFEDNFGTLPSDVLKLNNLMGVWPGGCLLQMQVQSEDDNFAVTASFGLTNPDMPATLRSENLVQEDYTEGDQLVRSTSMRLVERERVSMPPGIAGYGYEVAVLTQEEYDWPAHFLSWLITHEINHDAGWLRRVIEEEAVLLKCPLRQYPSLKMILTKAAPPLPDSLLLPNGMAYLFVATSITDSEYAFAQKAGVLALLEALHHEGPGQLSVIFRSSCI